VGVGNNTVLTCLKLNTEYSHLVINDSHMYPMFYIHSNFVTSALFYCKTSSLYKLNYAVIAHFILLIN